MVLKKPATYLTERFHLAVKYATFWHRHQVRKSTDLTYILHPLGVASLVLEAGGNEDEAIAALLHDVPEDCGGQVMLYLGLVWLRLLLAAVTHWSKIEKTSPSGVCESKAT